ncbi:oligosaccharide flippase family protein [Eggerthella sp. YY7918]|uniref:oligosaccharide flippase family protein n=1 Tax=Eggerthella sp. (strain YY7918) TaxID=502558 RepID=UPI0003055C09|nr:oligosaccharide flippase family protein [Eggerthella sp. YY7918]
MDKNAKQRQGGAILSYLYSFAQVVVGLLYVPLLLTGIGASEYGLYQLIGSIISYISVMGAIFSGGITRFYCKYYSEKNIIMMENTLAIGRSIYRIVSLIAIPVGVAAAVTMRFIYSSSLTEFQLMESSFLIAILVANLIVMMNNTLNVAIINAHERFIFLKITQLLTAVAQPIITVFAIILFPTATTVCAIQFGLNILCAIVQRIYARRVLKAKVVLHHRDKRLFREILLFSSGILFVLIADQVFWKTNQLILGYLYGTSVVAVYAIAMQICMIYQPIGTAIASVFMPKVSQLIFKEKDMRSVSFLFNDIGRISSYPLFLVLLGFAVFGQDFISLWAGPDFEEAYSIALIVMVPFTIDLLQHLGLTILQVVNKYAFRGKVYLVMAILDVVLVLALSPSYGAVGSAVATAIALFLGSGLIMNIYYAKSVGLLIKDFWLGILKVLLPLVGFSVLFVVVTEALSLRWSTWMTLFVGIGVYTLLFALTSYFFSMSTSERDLVNSFFSKIKAYLHRG